MCLVSIVSSRVNTTCMVAIIIIALITEKHFGRMRDCEGTACLCGPGVQTQGQRVDSSVQQKEELALAPLEKGQAAGRQ